MEELFSANIAVNNESILYHVRFEDEQYLFESNAGSNTLPAFSLKREHDEWQEQEPLPPGIKTQAVDALEQYLLQQH